MLSIVKNVITALSTLSGLLGLVPYITTLVEQVENTGATGAQKKEAVLNLVSAALNTVDSAFSIDLPTTTIISCVSNLIDVIVDFKNLIGAFTHSSTTTTDTSTATAQ
ncbi:hypothetical protein LLG46_02430 [bacterium]|nr:hypothetical protein [bacterium]